MTNGEISFSHAALPARLRERDRSEHATRESEGRLVQALQYARSERDRAEMYLDIAGVIIVALDFDGRITLINRRGCEILGFTESELLAKNWFTSFVPQRAQHDMFQRFREVMRGARAGGEPEEYPIVTRGGAERIISWHHALLRTEGSEKIIGTLSSGEDITTFREQQRELQTGARQQAGVADLGLRALSGVELDTLFGDAVRLLVRTLDVEYTNVLQLLPDGERLLLRAGAGWRDGLVGVEVFPAAQSQAGVALRSSEPVVVEDLRRDTRFRDPAFILDHNIAGAMSVVIQGRGEPFGVLGVFTTQPRRFDEEDIDFLQAIANVLADAIERRRAEEEIRAQTERLRLALQAARMGTWEWDITTNQARRSEDTASLLGLPPGRENDGLDAFFSAVHPEDREQLRRTIDACLEDDECEDYSAEYRVVWPDGTSHWLADRGRVYRDRFRKPVRLAGVTMDISARKQAEEQARLHQSELAHVMRISDVDEMASGLAHELNQPLTAVVNFAQGALRRLRSGDTSSPGFVEAIEGTASQAHRAGEIVRRLAKFVQKREPQQTVFVINDAVHEVISLTAAEARDYEAVIRAELDLENPSVSADNIQIEQVMVNLVRNGLEAMVNNKPNNRVLTIRTSVTDGEVHLTVADRGPGLSEDTLKRLFEPFYTTKTHGMGLGLSISRSIIDAHGGRLWASNHPNGGAVFEFTLPLVPGEVKSPCASCAEK